MTILIIRNKNISTALRKPIHEAWVRYVEHNAGKQNSSKELSVYEIRNKQEFDTYDINIEKPDQIFILTELNWQDGIQLLNGYNIATIIIQSVTNLYVPNIQFITVNERIQIYSQTNSSLTKCYIKSFKHYKLPDVYPAFNLFNVSKWKYLKKYVLTETGILDKIYHDVSNLLKEKRNDEGPEVHSFVSKVFNLNAHILGERNIVGEKVYQICSQLKMKRPSKTRGYIEFLLSLFFLITERINELSPTKQPRALPAKKFKYNILVVEDDVNMLRSLTEILAKFYTVVPFSKGDEAMAELKVAGTYYAAVISDLELLEENGIFDQDIQGIEILDYCDEHLPHIVKKVITALPRKGILELLPKTSYEDILHKSLLTNFGANELLLEFVNKLDNDIRKYNVLLKQPGPNNIFWDDNGGKFKRFYYDLKLIDPEVFNAMWFDIYKTADDFIAGKEVKISSVFGKTSNAKEISSQNDRGKTISFLKQVLTHRLVMISLYRNNDTVIYKDKYDRTESYIDMPIWESNLPISPKRYFQYLGFGHPDLDPDEPRKETEKITFNLRYNQLFCEEIEWLKSHSELRDLRISDFYQSNEEFCKTLDYILEQIIKDKFQRGTSSQFKNVYPALLDNIIEMDETYAQNVLQSLANENKVLNRHKLRIHVYEELYDFKFSQSDEIIELKSKHFISLSRKLQILIDNALNILHTP